MKRVIISQSYNDRLASAHKVQQAKCRRVFNYHVYPLYPHNISSFLVGLVPKWELQNSSLPTHFPKSSQGHVPPWEKKVFLSK